VILKGDERMESQPNSNLIENPSPANPSAFQDLLRRIRAGDPQAEREVWDLYFPAIQREVRARLAPGSIRRVLDSADVCQSVFVSFYMRARQGQYELDSARDLGNLLYAMARHKLFTQVRNQCAARRHPGRVGPDRVDELEVVAEGPSPSEQVAVRDLAQHFLARLTEDERRVADLYSRGHTWDEIAARLGEQPDALRKRLMRALNRVKTERSPAEDLSGQRGKETAE
jgi:RNA polymerase sigma factor (sigma-70 family)